MKKLTYNGAVHEVLAPHGFVPDKGRRNWRRQVGAYLDEVNLQLSPGLEEITVNLGVRDVPTRHTIRQLASGVPGQYYTANIRLKRLMGPNDWWWARNDPDGPSDMAVALKEYGLPFLDGMHSPLAVVGHLGPFHGHSRWSWGIARLEVAINLARLGQTPRAAALLAEPNSKIEPEAAAGFEAVRTWILEGCPPLRVDEPSVEVPAADEGA